MFADFRRLIALIHRDRRTILLTTATLVLSMNSLIPALQAQTANSGLSAAQPEAFEEHELWRLWRAHRVLPRAPACIGHDQVMETVDALSDRYPDRLAVEDVGRSFEGRTIRMLTIGAGSRRALLWSQMHGDEPSATPAVFDFIDYLLGSGDERSRRILDAWTLHFIPMLNPDGSERGTRRSAQGIDINRDALQLATPEGRLLKSVRDRLDPEIGFNLHDQDRRKLVADTGRLATQSVLAVAGDEAQTLTEGRRRAMRVCAVVSEAFQEFIPGGVGRFNEDWNARAFGDNVTAWGTPVVLLESGGAPPGMPMSTQSGLTFVALVRAFEELTRNDAADFDIETYRAIPRNRNDGLVDVAMRGADLLESNGKEWRLSSTDFGFDVNTSERELACADPEEREPVEALRDRGVGHRGSSIQEVGDTRFLVAVDAPDVEGRVLVPSLRLWVDGGAAQAWLSEAVLSAWTRLGVANVVWTVEAQAFGSATAFADTLSGVDRPRMVVRLQDDGGSDGPVLRARAAPMATADELDLRGVLAALTGDPVDDDLIRSVLLDTTPLRRFRRASFLVLAPASVAVDAAVDEQSLAARRLEAVWLDGRRQR